MLNRKIYIVIECAEKHPCLVLNIISSLNPLGSGLTSRYCASACLKSGDTKGTKVNFESMLECIRDMPDKRILEVGTFAGTSIATMADMFPDAECYAIDNWGLSEVELESCSYVSGHVVYIESSYTNSSKTIYLDRDVYQDNIRS